MNLILLNTILFSHWISDFVLQKNDRKDKTKNKNIKHILPHTLIYSLILSFSVYILELFKILEPKYTFSVFLFFVITYITHFLTDYCVTKINEKHLKNRRRHKLLVSIGFDQFLHISILFLTIKLIYNI